MAAASLLAVPGADAADATMPFDAWLKARPALEDKGSVLGKSLCKLLDQREEQRIKRIDYYLELTLKEAMPAADVSTALATPACYKNREDYKVLVPWLHLVAADPDTRLPILTSLESYYRQKLARPEAWKALLAAKDSRGYSALDNVEEDRRADADDAASKPAQPRYIAYLCQNGVKYAHFPNRCDAAEYPAAVAALEAKARAGDAKAMMLLADMYVHGLGVAKSPSRAIGYYRQAAAAGDAEGQKQLESAFMYGIDGEGKNWAAAADIARRKGDFMELGSMYERGGPGFPKDARAALDAYRKAADANQYAAYVKVTRLATELGDFATLKRYAELGSKALAAGSEDYAELMMRLARIYKDGSGAARDESRFIALRYAFSACECVRRGSVERQFTDRSDIDIIERFAQRGDERAQYLMGEQYVWGRLGNRDYAGGSSWYLKAAQAGEPFSQEKVGLMYRSGSGLPQDLARSREWFLKAAKQGHEGAQHTIDHWND